MSRAGGNLVADHSISSLTGASQSLLAQDMVRTFVLIENPSASNSIAVNLTGGTAALNTAGSVMIAPGGSLWCDEFVVTNAITVIGTAGQGCTCYTNP